jgi:outer membrane receptor protein involved in Fe transport
LDNDVKVSDLNNNQLVTVDSFTEASKLDEKIGALYSSVNYSPNDKTHFNVGLRYEYSETVLNVEGKGNVLDLTINKVFPTIFISRKVSELITLQASYGKRITRPSFGDLAPFFIFLDPTTFSFGNTSLKPAISNSLRLGLNYRNSAFAFERSHNKNAIEGYQPILISGTNKQVYTTLNIALIKTTSLSAAIPLKIARGGRST